MVEIGLVEQRRWNRQDGVIIEKTLCGNIRITNATSTMLSRGTAPVEDGVVDLTSYRHEFAQEELAPVLRDAGYDVELAEPEEQESLWNRIKTLITG